MADEIQSLVRRERPEYVAFPRVPIARAEPAARQLSLAELWSVAVRRWRIILGAAAAVFLLVAAYTFLKTPVYEGVARLQIDPNRSSTLGLDDSEKPQSALDVDGRVKTEVAIIQSNTVALQVMRAMGLPSNPSFAGKDSVPSTVSDPAQLQPSVRERLLNRFNDSLLVKVLPATQVVEIRFRSTDPTVATGAANLIIDQYMERNFRVRMDGTTQVSEWLAKQMEEIRASTTAAQQKLADFQRAHNMLGTDESDNIVTDRLKQLNEELTQAEADRIVKEGRYRLARSGDPELIATVVPGTTLQILRSQEADLRAQYDQVSAKFGSGYPKVRELESQVNSVENAIRREQKKVEARLGNEYDGAAKTENMIRGQFDQQKNEAYKLNENVGQYAILKHEVESGQQLYDTLRLKVKEAGVTSGLASSYVTIVDRAQLPDKPVEPRKALYLAMGLGGGLFTGLLLGFIVDTFDDTIQGAQDVEAVTGLPELNSVPYMASIAGRSRKSGKGELVGPEMHQLPALDSNSQAGESFRALSSFVLLSAIDNPPKVLVVASALPGEGKSTVSCNLATALARTGRRVLLVDGDLRCSSLHSRFGITRGPGLTSMFSSRPTEYPRYRPFSSLPNLHVVPAGFRPAGPTEVLASARMQQLIAAWRMEYDHVIVDTPPMLPFADGVVLAARADGVILVTRAGTSQKRALARACDVLGRSGANVLGFVLNAVRRPEYFYQYPAAYRELTPAGHDGASAVNS